MQIDLLDRIDDDPAVDELAEKTAHLEAAMARLRTLASELALAEERERRRIGAGLHDQIGQVLATAQLRLGALQESEADPERRHSLAIVRELLERALAETSALTFELSCPILHQLGLGAALENLGERLEERNGVRFEVDADPRAEPIGEQTRVILYRVVRELFYNVVRHAQAKRARLVLSRDGAQLRLNLEDDGVGIRGAVGDEPSAAGGFGLFAVRERLHQLGGSLEVGAAGGGGTRMVITVPHEPGTEEPRP